MIAKVLLDHSWWGPGDAILARGLDIIAIFVLGECDNGIQHDFFADAAENSGRLTCVPQD